MARHWREPLDPNRQVEHLRTHNIGGTPPDAPPDPLVERWVYFVTACSFTFQFQSVAQIEECLDFFARKLHPTSRRPGVTLEHYWQAWHERLPRWLFAEPKRAKVVKALRAAWEEFGGATAERQR